MCKYSYNLSKEIFYTNKICFEKKSHGLGMRGLCIPTHIVYGITINLQGVHYLEMVTLYFILISYFFLGPAQYESGLRDKQVLGETQLWREKTNMDATNNMIYDVTF